MSERPGLVRLPAGGFRRTLWKNGGGVTLDIADQYRPGAEPGGWAGMVWRFGRTRIEVPAPFSDLSGHNRILVVIDGRGLVLRLAGGRAIDVTAPFRPVRFRGEDAIVSEIGEGPVGVVNLIGDREAVDIRLDVLDGAGALQFPAGEVVLYAPGRDAVCRIDGEATAIAGGDAVRLASREGVRVDGEGGTVVVACISPRRGGIVPSAAS